MKLLNSSTMTLLSDPACHYSHRLRIILAEKDIAYNLQSCTTEDLSEEVMASLPYPQLPVLASKELILYNTKIMMEFLDDRFPHPPLLPIYPKEKALFRLWIYRIDTDWGIIIDKIVNKKASKTDVKELRDSILSISPFFADKPYFMSHDFNIVDCCLIPILWRLKVLEIDIEKQTNNRQAKALLDYMERAFERDSVRKSLSEIELEMR